MKTQSIIEAIELEQKMRIESREREEMYLTELAKKNPFKRATTETDDNGVEFNVHYAIMTNTCFSAQGYDSSGKYREKNINFCDVG